MNKADTNELTEYWRRETRYVNDKVDEAFKDAQDHAYALGLKRGKEEVTDLAKRLVAARDLASKQAEDSSLWFVPMTATEDYLQRALMDLASAITSCQG